MGQILHGSATTAEAANRAIKFERQESTGIVFSVEQSCEYERTDLSSRDEPGRGLQKWKNHRDTFTNVTISPDCLI